MDLKQQTHQQKKKKKAKPQIEQTIKPTALVLTQYTH